ncbi:hypothetical protein MSAN_00796700 [Mycena sanguinolenta]|uniref:Uncharacterized protein n=1 Tax=Mycena sanguinolenta TaxID=230812 RepID=A0A8H6YVT9_9AGAR|nr:hypothetical protein MSAN_00796700 [Mycena sanguinolenta]
MRPQEPTFPSFSLVLSQTQLSYSSPPSPRLGSPWASLPLAVAATPTPNPSLPLQPPVQNSQTPRKILVAIRRFFAAIVDNLKRR